MTREENNKMFDVNKPTFIFIENGLMVEEESVNAPPNYFVINLDDVEDYQCPICHAEFYMGRDNAPLICPDCKTNWSFAPTNEKIREIALLHFEKEIEHNLNHYNAVHRENGAD